MVRVVYLAVAAVLFAPGPPAAAAQAPGDAGHAASVGKAKGQARRSYFRLTNVRASANGMATGGPSSGAVAAPRAPPTCPGKTGPTTATKPGGCTARAGRTRKP